MKFFTHMLILNSILMHLTASCTTYEMGEVERYKFKIWQHALDHNHLNQQDIDNVLIDATFCGHRAIVALILNLPEGNLKPAKESVHKVFQRAFSVNNQEIMKLVVSLPISRRPDQNIINEAHDKAVLTNNTAMANILSPYVIKSSA